MKAKLEFDLDDFEDEQLHEIYVNAPKLRAAIVNLREFLISYKYKDLDDSQEEILDEIKTKLGDLLGEIPTSVISS